MKHRDPFLGTSKCIPTFCPVCFALIFAGLFAWIFDAALYPATSKDFHFHFHFQVQLPSSQVSLAIQGWRRDRLQPFPLPTPGEESFDSCAQQTAWNHTGWKKPLRPTSPRFSTAKPTTNPLSPNATCTGFANTSKDDESTTLLTASLHAGITIRWNHHLLNPTSSLLEPASPTTAAAPFSLSWGTSPPKSLESSRHWVHITEQTPHGSGLSPTWCPERSGRCPHLSSAGCWDSIPSPRGVPRARLHGWKSRDAQTSAGGSVPAGRSDP